MNKSDSNRAAKLPVCHVTEKSPRGHINDNQLGRRGPLVIIYKAASRGLCVHQVAMWNSSGGNGI